jgi:hypothetical protein
MATSTNNSEFSSGFVALIQQFHLGQITATTFTTQLLALVDDWDAITPAQLATNVTGFVANQRVWQKELRDWWAGTVTGGPNGDGLYPFTNDLGVVSYAPCPALLQNPVLGPAGQAANAALIAQNAANTAVIAAAGINANTAMIAQNLTWAQANAVAAAASAAGAATSNTNANASKVAAATSEANALGYRNTAQTNANTSTTQAGIATTQAGYATANAVIATTQAGIATTQATYSLSNATSAAGSAAGAATSNTNANASKVAAAASEANALAYRNTAQTYSTTATTQAGYATANAVIATTQAGIATTNATYTLANATAAAGSAGTATTQAGIATANAVIAATQAGIATANATSAALANASAWTARAGAATSEANALAYRNTTLTYRDNAANSATQADTSKSNAIVSANTATTRAIAAETAQAAAETARAQAQNAANVALIAAANAAASVGFNIADYQLRSEKGQANGFASLDANGKVPIGQLDTAVLGGLKYMGTWNASTNSPTIPAAALSNKGQYYKVGTAGTSNVGGYTDWQVGDWVLSDGTIWDKIDNTDQVQSVAGRTGAVTLTKADVGLSAVDNTADSAKPVSAATQTALNLKLDVSLKATTTQALVGADDTTWMTPAKTTAAISNAIASRTQFSTTVTATGSSQTVNLGVDVQPGELLIYVNGVEQDGVDFAKSGTNWTFTRPAGSRIRFMLPGGVRGQSFDADASGTTAGRSTYDSQPVGFCYLATDTGSFSWRTGNAGVWTNAVTLTGPQGDQGPVGNAGVNGSNGVNGWTPVLSLVADGIRYVAKVTDWTGGTTGKPTANVYVTSTGFTSNVALATDIRGPQGVQGNQGNPGLNGSNGVGVTYSLINPAGLASANAVGVANVAAREDHVHQFPLARISNAMTANASLTLADHGGVVEWGAAANGTITLPNNLPAGFNCLVRVTAASTIPTFTPIGGAVMRQADGLTKARKQWSEVSVSVRGNANGTVAEYVLSGDMS